QRRFPISVASSAGDPGMSAHPTRTSRWENWLPDLVELHGPRILVVEDDRELEPLVRRAAGSLIPPVAVDWCTSTQAAHELLASSFYAAVLAAGRRDGGLSGIALRSDCWELQPQAVFAMTSAYPLSRYLYSVGSHAIPFLAKPFDISRCRQFLS